MELFLMHQVTSALLACTNKIRRYGDQCHPNLTLNQWMVLFSITHLDKEGAEVEKISGMLGTMPNQTRQLAARLQQKGYVQQTARQDKTLLALTLEGEEATASFYENCVPPLMQATKCFTVEELDFFWECLRRLYAFDGEDLIGLELKGKEWRI